MGAFKRLLKLVLFSCCWILLAKVPAIAEVYRGWDHYRFVEPHSSDQSQWIERYVGLLTLWNNQFEYSRFAGDEPLDSNQRMAALAELAAIERKVFALHPAERAQIYSQIFASIRLNGIVVPHQNSNRHLMIEHSQFLTDLWQSDHESIRAVLKIVLENGFLASRFVQRNILQSEFLIPTELAIWLLVPNEPYDGRSNALNNLRARAASDLSRRVQRGYLNKQIVLNAFRAALTRKSSWQGSAFPAIFKALREIPGPESRALQEEIAAWPSRSLQSLYHHYVVKNRTEPVAIEQYGIGFTGVPLREPESGLLVVPKYIFHEGRGYSRIAILGGSPDHVMDGPEVMRYQSQVVDELKMRDFLLAPSVDRQLSPYGFSSLPDIKKGILNRDPRAVLALFDRTDSESAELYKVFYKDYGADTHPPSDLHVTAQQKAIMDAWKKPGDPWPHFPENHIYYNPPYSYDGREDVFISVPQQVPSRTLIEIYLRREGIFQLLRRKDPAARRVFWELISKDPLYPYGSQTEYIYGRGSDVVRAAADAILRSPEVWADEAFVKAIARHHGLSNLIGTSLDQDTFLSAPLRAQIRRDLIRFAPETIFTTEGRVRRLTYGATFAENLRVRRRQGRPSRFRSLCGFFLERRQAN